MSVKPAIGGLLGGLIMGLYWTITTFFFAMHCDDAFGALGLRDYKHFLRMRFEPEQVTIYPIAVDRIPDRKGWRVANAADKSTHNPQIVPIHSLDPHLIEPPIIIRAADVRGEVAAVAKS